MEFNSIASDTTDYPKDALPVGTVIEGYKLLSLLGRGAFGITYLASEEKLDRLVAIKEYLPKDFAIRDESSTVRARTGSHGKLFEYGRESFLREARTLVKFKHHNIVRVLTFFEHYNTAYLVMEYEEGVDLKQYLKQKPHLTQSELLSIFLPINQGLSIVHEHGFIHRDIKPANIYIREDHSPVLLDFGAARDVVKNKVNELTRILTEGYAPYEQDNPSWSDQGPWTDIYALGATLYMTIMGKKPASSSQRAAAHMMKKDDPYQSALTAIKKGYSPPFLAAIDKALEFHPESRPQSLKQWSLMLNQKGDDATVLMPRTGERANTDDLNTRVHQAEASSVDSASFNADSNTEKIRTFPVKPVLMICTLLVISIAGGYFIFTAKFDNIAIPTQAETDALESLVNQAMLFARTATVQYASAQTNKKHLEEYKKAFSSGDNRTAFIVALQKKVDQAERDFEKNFSQYSIILIKLGRYASEDVESEVKKFLEQPDYSSEKIYQQLGSIIVKHATTGIGSSASWKPDLLAITVFHTSVSISE